MTIANHLLMIPSNMTERPMSRVTQNGSFDFRLNASCLNNRLDFSPIPSVVELLDRPMS